MNVIKLASSLQGIADEKHVGFRRVRPRLWAERERQDRPPVGTGVPHLEWSTGLRLNVEETALWWRDNGKRAKCVHRKVAVLTKFVNTGGNKKRRKYEWELGWGQNDRAHCVLPLF